MILYIIYILIIIYFLFVAFIKFKFRFWANQPVFHIYNFLYWIYPCGVIQVRQPPITNFYDNKILTKKWQDFSNIKKELFYNLIQLHFLNKKKEKYNPPRYAVMDYFNEHNNNCYLSLLKKNNIIISGITSRPLNATLNKNNIIVNYVDFLCIHKSYRKKGLAQNIIYSHYFNVRKDKASSIFLFKREGSINFIVPLTIYIANVFSLKYLKDLDLNLPSDTTCHLVNNLNFSLFLNFFQEIKNNFKCFITPDVSHIKHLVSKKLLFIFLIMKGTKPIATYIYRIPFITYEKKQSIELISSYYKPEYYDEYIKSFKNTINLINKQLSIDILILEKISNNIDLNNFLIKKYSILWKCPMAYFLYNFYNKPFYPNDVFLIN